MQVPMNTISDPEVDAEQTLYERASVLKKIKTHPFPLQSIPTPRDFERLVFYLFKGIQVQSADEFETVWLMQGSKDRGRDIVLRKQSVTIGYYPMQEIRE
jgi:hypothetical protein